MKTLPLVYLAAGLSKRFGGKIKQLAHIGPHNETLIGYSINQAANAGFQHVILVVSKKTEEPLRNVLGNSHQGIHISYARQEFDLSSRDSPWGTLDALCTASNLLDSSFVVCNGDDLYGATTFRMIRTYLEEHNCDVTVGYRLIDVLPETGSVNRGIFEITGEHATSLREEISLTRDNYTSRGLSQDTPCSMNIFGLTTRTLEKLQKLLHTFKEKNTGNRTVECMLPTEIGHLLTARSLRLYLLQTPDTWVGITHPEDEEKAMKELSNYKKNKM